MATPTRKSVALMELVSIDSPKKIHAREGLCHRISPIAKRQTLLMPTQIGVSRSLPFSFEDDIGADLPSLIDAAVKKAVHDALVQERKKQLIGEEYNKDDLLFCDVKRGLISGITLRSLVYDWSKTVEGATQLREFTHAVNLAFEEGKKCHELPYYRKVMHGDLLLELKTLTRKAEKKQENGVEAFINAAQSAIEISSGLPGIEFMSMVRGYVQANQQVHVEWTPEKLMRVLEMVEEGSLQIEGQTPATWIKKMVDVIAKAHKWTVKCP